MCVCVCVCVCDQVLTFVREEIPRLKVCIKVLLAHIDSIVKTAKAVVCYWLHVRTHTHTHTHTHTTHTQVLGTRLYYVDSFDKLHQDYVATVHPQKTCTDVLPQVDQQWR